MNLGMPEMIFLAVIGLLLFGPRKLPEMGRQLGRALAEFKRASNEFKSQLDAEVRQLEYEAEQEKPSVSVSDSREEAENTIAPPAILPPANTESRSPRSLSSEAALNSEAALSSAEAPLAQSTSGTPIEDKA